VFEPPAWFWQVLGTAKLGEGKSVSLNGRSYRVQGGILRSSDLLSSHQAATGEAFGYKWKRTDTFDSDASRLRARAWLVERYGDLRTGEWLRDYETRPLLLDAGCGAGLSGLELFGPIMDRLRYLAVDVSEAVDVAAARFHAAGHSPGLMQADICRLPLPPASVDVIFSEGVLHHTDSTESALKSLAALLKPGGRFMFYVYRRKGPIREFTDDYIRARLQPLSQEQRWRVLEPLTKLGIALGQLDAYIDIEEPIEILGIPRGRINVQRLFYWHVAKMFYSPELNLSEMNHINFDWYAPANAHRQTPEEVRLWCSQAGLHVEREVVEEAGITVIARRGG
jgi:SAM-dependent methyltransferase